MPRRWPSSTQVQPTISPTLDELPLHRIEAAQPLPQPTQLRVARSAGSVAVFLVRRLEGDGIRQLVQQAAGLQPFCLALTKGGIETVEMGHGPQLPGLPQVLLAAVQDRASPCSARGASPSRRRRSCRWETRWRNSHNWRGMRNRFWRSLTSCWMAPRMIGHREAAQTGGTAWIEGLHGPDQADTPHLDHVVEGKFTGFAQAARQGEHQGKVVGHQVIAQPKPDLGIGTGGVGGQAMAVPLLAIWGWRQGVRADFLCRDAARADPGPSTWRSWFAARRPWRLFFQGGGWGCWAWRKPPVERIFVVVSRWPFTRSPEITQARGTEITRSGDVAESAPQDLTLQQLIGYMPRVAMATGSSSAQRSRAGQCFSRW